MFLVSAAVCLQVARLIRSFHFRTHRHSVLFCTVLYMLSEEMHAFMCSPRTYYTHIVAPLMCAARRPAGRLNEPPDLSPLLVMASSIKLREHPTLIHFVNQSSVFEPHTNSLIIYENKLLIFWPFFHCAKHKHSLLYSFRKIAYN